jgi:predicted HAD superfamily phosphohydrolase
MLIDLFFRFGKEYVIRLAEVWSINTLEKFCVVATLIKKIIKLGSESFPKVKRITSENMENIVNESDFFRKTVRGEEIGGLG